MKNVKQHINDTALQSFAWSDEGGRNALADTLANISDTHAKDRAIAFAHQMANPGSSDPISPQVYDAMSEAYDQWVLTAEI